MSGKCENYINWDEYLMGVAHFSVLRSEGPNTQVGTYIVSDDNKVLSMGYNGFPRDCLDGEFPRGEEHEQDNLYQAKCFCAMHSEPNAILNYREGSPEGSEPYVILFPRNECAKVITQNGTRTLIYEEDKHGNTAAVRASRYMLNAAGVRYYQYTKTGRKLQIVI